MYQPLSFPKVMAEIPDAFERPANCPGKLVNLNYQTWEAFTYQKRLQRLKKRAVVYLPYNYDPKQQYNVFYLMHGGWSNETTYLGIPGKPSTFKNVIDNAVETKTMAPMIIVCPTYNNTSVRDSSDYSMAVELTARYPQELVNDLIPAVEGTFSTFAASTDRIDLRASRDHRAFGGFSMGSVATWQVFAQCLDVFRYFFPSSGNLTADGKKMAKLVKDQGFGPEDFFIFAASGTHDFAYPAFSEQIQNMSKEDLFQTVSNEQEGNLCYRIKRHGVHGKEDALQYFYQAMSRIWKPAEK